MSARTETLIWTAQRASAVLLALCVFVHLVTVIYAVRNGLSAPEILGRTRGNPSWASFYTVFVVSAAVHAPIGIRAIAAEWLRLNGRTPELLAAVSAIAVLILGLRAVWAVCL